MLLIELSGRPQPKEAYCPFNSITSMHSAETKGNITKVNSLKFWALPETVRPHELSLHSEAKSSNRTYITVESMMLSNIQDR
jgi:hypothetical protein